MREICQSHGRDSYTTHFWCSLLYPSSTIVLKVILRMPLMRGALSCPKKGAERANPCLIGRELSDFERIRIWARKVGPLFESPILGFGLVLTNPDKKGKSLSSQPLVQTGTSWFRETERREGAYPLQTTPRNYPISKWSWTLPDCQATSTSPCFCLGLVYEGAIFLRHSQLDQG